MQHQTSPPPTTTVPIKLKSPLNVRFDPKFHSVRNLSGRGQLSIVDVLNKTADKTVHSQNPGKEAICERGEAGLGYRVLGIAGAIGLEVPTKGSSSAGSENEWSERALLRSWAVLMDCTTF